MAQDLRGVENQLQRHEGLARELAGMEQQVSRLLPALQPGLFVHARAWPRKFPGLSTQTGNLPWDAQILSPHEETALFPYPFLLAAGTAEGWRQGSESVSRSSGPGRCPAEAASCHSSLEDPTVACRAA